MARSGTARTRPAEGPFVEFDPGDYEPFAEFCGGQWEGFSPADPETGLVRGRGRLGPDGKRLEGALAEVRRGARAVELHGPGGGVSVVAPENFEDDGQWEADWEAR